MHPVSKKCIRWAVALLIVGAVLMVLVPLLGAFAGSLGSNPASAVVSVLLSLLQTTAIPVGASLLGAAIVIQVLAPARQTAAAIDSEPAE